MLKIQKGIPIPPKLSALVLKMRKNESIFVAGKKPNEISGCTTKARNKGYRFTMRSEKGTQPGTRIWRTK